MKASDFFQPGDVYRVQTCDGLFLTGQVEKVDWPFVFLVKSIYDTHDFSLGRRRLYNAMSGTVLLQLNIDEEGDDNDIE